MQIIDLPTNTINGNDLSKHVQKSLEQARGDGSREGEKAYIKSLKLLKKEKIPTLKAIDKFTTGLRVDKWNALVNQEGTTSKDGMAAGGSYGIGKNAPYVASELDLVCYSTRFLEKGLGRSEKFIARCKLIAHDNPAEPGRMLQHVGFGTSKQLAGRWFSPMEGNEINDIFRLPETGTGVFIVGFAMDDWQRKARRSIASNFFAAIHDAKLAVTVGDTDIAKDNLNSEDFGSDGKKHYYDLYKSPEKPAKIEEEFGSFYLKVAANEDTMKNRVAYINRRGMLITDESVFKRNPFRVKLGHNIKYMAIVYAADDKTDAKVRSMEAPNHQAIEYMKLTDNAERDRVKDELRKLNRAIVERIKERLNLNSFGSDTNLSELADILPYVSESGNYNKHDETNSEPNDVIEYAQIPMPKNMVMSATSDTETESDDNGSRGSTGRTDARGKKVTKKRPANMADVRVIRNGGILRVAFTPKTGANKFSVMPAGEEDKPEDPVPILRAENASQGGHVPTLADDIVSVNASGDGRVVLDLHIDPSTPYTGYSIEEFATRRRKS